MRPVYQKNTLHPGVPSIHSVSNFFCLGYKILVVMGGLGVFESDLHPTASTNGTALFLYES